LLLSVPLLSSAEDKLLVPANFVVPAVLENKHFRIRTLTVNDVIKDYDAILFKTVKEWIANDWPLENPAYPGRDISWDKWEKL
jgi:hypothetical protein